MYTRRIRFTSQWALVGVILFYAVGTALLAWHSERRIITPTSAGGSECVKMFEISSLLEPSRCDASRRVVGNYRYNSAIGIGLIPSDENGSGLNSFGDVFGIPISSLENPGSDARDFDMLDIIRADSAAGNIEEDELILHTERFSDGSTNETPAGWNIEETNDTEAMSAPAIRALTKIQTQAKCVEAILKSAIIEPYLINGQIEGLQISGLEKILIARDLFLRSGDIIRAVNGQPLNSKRGAYEIFKRARKLPIMKIELLRDGKTETLLYYLR